MGELVDTKEDLIRYFTSGAKPREQWRVGTEYEKIAVEAATGKAVPYSGPDGVETMMRELIDRFGWEPEDEENGHLLALSRGPARVTIEPGAQIELSGEQCESIHCAHREFTQHVAELIDVGHSHDAVLLGLGMTPVSRIDEIELLPKHRYHIMYPYMARKGRLGQRMMKQTAGVQANLDYSSEADAMRKFRVAMGIVPLVYAMFANSPLADGGLNGYQAFRGHIWTDTDPDRCGILEFAFRRERQLRGLHRICARRADVLHRPRSQIRRHDQGPRHHVSPIHGSRLRQGARDHPGLGRSSHHDFHRGAAEEVHREPHCRQSAARADARAARAPQGHPLQ